MKAVTAILLLAAAAAASAHADSCAQTETAVRERAAEGQAIMAQMQEVQNQHTTTQWSISMEQAALDDYGWDPETEDYTEELQAALRILEQRWNALNAELVKLDPIVTEALQTYETACGADADTASLLRGLGLNPG